MQLLKRSSFAILWILMALTNMGQDGCPVEEGSSPAGPGTGSPQFFPQFADGTGSAGSQTFTWTLPQGTEVPTSVELEVLSLRGEPLLNVKHPLPEPATTGIAPRAGLFCETQFLVDGTTTVATGVFAGVVTDFFSVIPQNQPGGDTSSTVVGASGENLFIIPKRGLVGKILLRDYRAVASFLEPAVPTGDDFEFLLYASFLVGNRPALAGQPGLQLVQTHRLLSDKVQVLPHVPFGAFSGLRLIIQVIVNNPHDEDVDVQMNFFDSMTGDPLEVPLEGVTASRQNLTVEGNSSRLLEIESDEAVRTAWGLVSASQPVGVSTNFLTLDPAGAQQASGMVVAEAGIAASGVSTRHVLNILRTGIGVSTAIAAVNVTSSVANVRVTLLEGSGAASLAGNFGLQGQAVVGEAVFPVGPRVQAARFFDDLFEIPAGDFSGTIVLESDASLAVASIKTVNGIQSSSLPSGSP